MDYEIGSANEKSIEPIRVYNNINTQNIIINMGSNTHLMMHKKQSESLTSACDVGNLEENNTSS